MLQTPPSRYEAGLPRSFQLCAEPDVASLAGAFGRALMSSLREVRYLEAVPTVLSTVIRVPNGTCTLLNIDVPAQVLGWGGEFILDPFEADFRVSLAIFDLVSGFLPHKPASNDGFDWTALRKKDLQGTFPAVEANETTSERGNLRLFMY